MDSHKSLTNWGNCWFHHSSHVALNFDNHSKFEIRLHKLSSFVHEWELFIKVSTSKLQFRNRERCVMWSHLVPPFCLCLCTPPQLCLCCYIILSPLHLCCVHMLEFIPFISTTMVHLTHFIYHSPSLIFTIFGHTHVTLPFIFFFTID